MLSIRLVKLGLEEYHHPVLEEVVVLYGVGVEPLSLVIVQPIDFVMSPSRTLEEHDSRLLLLVHVYLETDDIAILNLTLSEGQLGLHELNHARFDFLNQRCQRLLWLREGLDCVPRRA